MNKIAKSIAEDKEVCPYCDDNAGECKASVTSLKLGALLRLNRCNSESYDNCSLYLAKCLRSGW
ncbi:MAG: hypothetical protein H6Q93_1523, partial [Nitrospirae bacterium]|nr:hypothetical protein [Nitrospirota bacterium]